jgi:hypothetical protein
MSVLLFFTYLIGLFVAGTVFIARPGLLNKKITGGANYREFLIPNLGWTLLWSIKTVFWPVVFVFWAVTLFRPSPWKATIRIDGREVRKIQRVRAW